jgi:hypothetical protein
MDSRGLLGARYLCDLHGHLWAQGGVVGVARSQPSLALVSGHGSPLKDDDATQKLKPGDKTQRAKKGTKIGLLPKGEVMAVFRKIARTR